LWRGVHRIVVPLPARQARQRLHFAGGRHYEARRPVAALRAARRRLGRGLGTQLATSDVMPGDTIVVPEDFERTTWMKDLKDWSQVFYQFALGVAAIKVLRE